MDDLTTVLQRSAPPAPGNGLLACLTERDRDLLKRDLEPVLLERDQILAMPGQPMPWVHFPTGATMAALFAVMADGRVAVTGAVARDGAVGVAEVMGDDRSLSRVVTVIRGPALRIGLAKLATVARRSPGLRAVLGRGCQELTGQSMQLAACNALHSVKQRICRWILTAHDCVQEGGDPFEVQVTPLPLTQEMLGDALGVQRTTVTVAAMRLQQEGLVRYGRGRVFVLDRPRLERAACECHGEVQRRRRRLLAEAVTA